MKRFLIIFFLILTHQVGAQVLLPREVCPNEPEYVYLPNFEEWPVCPPGSSYVGYERRISVARGTTVGRIDGNNTTMEIIWPFNNEPKSIEWETWQTSCDGSYVDFYQWVTSEITLAIPAVLPPKPNGASNASTTLCPGPANIGLDVAAPVDNAVLEYIWEYWVVGDPVQTKITLQPVLPLDVPHRPGAQMGMRVHTRYKECIKTKSDWTDLGTWWIADVPPTVVVDKKNSRICTQGASVEINVASGGTSSDFTFAYNSPNGTGTYDFSGAGKHTIPLNMAAGMNIEREYTYQLVYKNKVTPEACATSSTFTIRDESYPVGLTATSKQQSCNSMVQVDGAVDLTVTKGAAPLSYQWTAAGTPVGNDQDLTNVAGGVTYSVSVSDAYGCTGTTAATVALPAPVTIDDAFLSSDHGGLGVSCHEDNTGGARSDGEVVIVASGGTDGLQYQLTGAKHTVAYQSSDRIGSLYADLYTVQVKDAKGCEAAITRTVDVTAPEAIRYTSISQTDLLCAGVPTGEIQVLDAAGGTGTLQYSITGSGFQTDPLFTSRPAQNYTVTIRDANGCVQQKDITLTEPSRMVFGQVNSALQTCAEHLDGEISLAPGTGGTGTRMYSLDGQAYVPESSPVLFTGLASANYTLYVRDDNQCVVTQNYFLGARPVLTADFDETVISCYGRTDGALTVTGNGGTGPYSYAWSTGATETTISNLGAAVYTVAVYDAKGCEKSFPYDLVQPGLLTPAAVLSNYTGFGVRCLGSTDGTIDLSVAGGTAPFTYIWSTGATQQDLSALAPGTYSTAVKDARGCEATLHNLTITEPTAITLAVNQTNDISCFQGEDGEVTLAATGGASVYLYAQDGGTQHPEPVFDKLKIGTYTFRVTDANGCAGQAEVQATLTEPEQLLLNLVSKIETKCNEANGEAVVLARGGVEAYTYTWYDAASTVYNRGASVTGLRGGDYRVVVEDAHACQTPLRVIINDSDGPRITQQELTGLTCFESNDGVIRISVAQGQAPYTIAWDMAGQTGTDVTGLTGGEHWVEVHDDRGCRAKEFYDVPSPAELKISAVITEPSCHGDTNGRIEIAATGGNAGPYAYAWGTGETTTVRENLAGGTYDVTVTDVRACTGHQTIIVSDPALFVVDAGGNRTICVGQAATIRAQEDNATYQWSSSLGFTSADREVVLREPTTYTLHVISARGCEASDSFVLATSTDLLKADFLMVNEAHAGDTVVVIDVSWPMPEGIRWEMPEGATLTAAEDVYGEIVFAQPGEYDIVLNTFLGECIADISKRITVLEAVSGNEGGRQPESIIGDFTIYPNPNEGRFTVSFWLRDEAVTGYVRMLPLDGSRQLLQVEVRGEGSYYYQGIPLPAGVYLVLLEAGDEKKVKRVVVK
jgi:hypothetical protein